MTETLLPEDAIASIREVLPELADQVVAGIIAEVPSYTDALGGPMGATIRYAVQTALGGFLVLASAPAATDTGPTPRAAAVDGAYQLGRGEARSGRTTDAILSAYRIGARISWREMSRRSVAAGLDAERLAAFAELVFAYIDQLSAASVAGHADESATTGRVRQRLLERLAHDLLAGAAPDDVRAAAERADWLPPTTLTAVIVPGSQARSVLMAVRGDPLPAGDAPGPGSGPGGPTDDPTDDRTDDAVVLLVPDVHGAARSGLLRTLRDRGGLAGPARPWLEVRVSYDRALRARALGVPLDTEAYLPELVLGADPAALADLRARALAPLAGLRPATADKLAETLRAWLLHLGRREDVAAALFVHPQTVRYRMGQVREAFGEALEDPETVRQLVLALGVSSPTTPQEGPVGSDA